MANTFVIYNSIKKEKQINFASSKKRKAKGNKIAFQVLHLRLFSSASKPSEKYLRRRRGEKRREGDENGGDWSNWLWLSRSFRR